ncbi:MAG TPA: excinuclease ABC subunit UvrC [Acidimicrobiia bacterium]|nr:excinuclease ABC subunit UvrC [Acidimicrobiia bacterium]
MKRPNPSEIPDEPGAYLFRDQHGQVIYAGKAKSLRKRIVGHFSMGSHLGSSMVDAADSVDWIVTANEVEALMLEYSLIQRHRPRFNYRLRDDKSYPFLAISVSEEWPRPRVMRGKKKKGTRYFGPFAHAYAVRGTLDLLLKAFPVRTCTDGKFRTHKNKGRPCLLYDIEKCSAPCVGLVSKEDYAAMVDGLSAFFGGDTDGIVDELERQMLAASELLEYEQAARLRDRLSDVRKAIERQEVVSERPEDFDLLALEDSEFEAAVQVLFVRRGRLVGRLGTIMDKSEDMDAGGVVAGMLHELYGNDVPPPAVLVQHEPPDVDVWQELLTEQRGSRVTIRVPQRGSKRRLMETAVTNASQDFARHRLRRQSDPNARARALRSLQEELDLPMSPLRIEAFDISTLQGRDTVGSMVVLEDGLPRRSDYRRFKVRTIQGQDDFAAMEEVLRRRFKAYLKERELPVEERGRFSYPPSLLLIDGGAGQLGRAVKVLKELDLDVPVAGLAKRMEEVYMPGRSEPVRIPRDEPALHLLQRVRDEAHRFAVEYHRKLRGKRMVDSILDEVPGLGPVRKKALIRRFGSLKGIRSATETELTETVPAQVAADLHAALHGSGR